MTTTPSSSFLNNIVNQFALPDCKYYTNDEFNSNFSKVPKINKLSLFHLNIRSLNANKDKLVQLLASVNNPFDVIVLTEICVYNIDFYSNLFPDFSFFYNLPHDSKVGGVGMYIHNSYQATVIYNGSKEDSDNHFENIIIELTKNECKFVVCGVYRHPSYLLTNFNKIFEDFLVQHFNKLINNDCWILADFNADISKYNNISEITLFLDNLLNLNFLPLITLPTRITKTSSTILDHIYLRPALNNKSSNINTSNLNVGCLVTDITDHIGIFSFLTLDKKRDVVNKERPLVRIFSKSNKNKFNYELANID